MTLKKLSRLEIFLAAMMVIIGTLMHLYGPREALDIKFFYTAAQANEFLDNLNLFDRDAYLFNEKLDVIFLSTYSLLAFLLARRFYGKVSWAALTPGIFDLMETITIILLLINKTWLAPMWLSYITCIKWTTGAIVGISIIRGPFKNT